MQHKAQSGKQAVIAAAARKIANFQHEGKT